MSPDPSDPLGEGVGTNRYIYGLGSPTWYRDPGGLNSRAEGKDDKEGAKCRPGWAWVEGLGCIQVTGLEFPTEVKKAKDPEFNMPGGRKGKDLNDDHLFDRQGDTEVKTRDIQGNGTTRQVIQQVRKENCEYYDAQFKEGLEKLVNGSNGGLVDVGVDLLLLGAGAMVPIGEIPAAVRFASRSKGALRAVLAAEKAQAALSAAAVQALTTGKLTLDVINAVKERQGLGDRPTYCSAN